MTKKAQDNKKKPDTTFKGAVNLDTIFASISKTPEVDIKLEEVKVKKPEEKEEVIVEDPIESPVEKPNLEEKPEIKEEPKEEVLEAPVIDKDNSTSAHLTAKKLIEFGVIDDFEIAVSDEDEGTLISEFYSMTDGQLEEIVNIHKQSKKSEISSKYISKEGLGEHEVKVIEILKNGGDLSKIAETEEQAFTRPFEGFDMTDQKRQVDVVYTDLVHDKKLSHEKALRLIKDSVKEGTLEAEATEIFNRVRKSHSDYIDSVLEKQRKEKEFKETNFKENKKALTAKLKEAGLKESAYKKVTSEYAKRDEKGNFLLIDKLKDILNNPEENHEVILHLTDKKLFNEVFKVKAAHTVQKEVIRLASGSNSKGNKRTLKTNDRKEETPWDRAARIHNEALAKK